MARADLTNQINGPVFMCHGVSFGSALRVNSLVGSLREGGLR